MDTHIHNHTHAHTHESADGIAPPHSHPHSHAHTHTQTRAVINRLSRAIGHLTRVREMVRDGHDCAEVLIQLSAVRAAINKTCEVILKDHLDHCVIDAVRSGDTATLAELNRAIEMLMQ